MVLPSCELCLRLNLNPSPGGKRLAPLSPFHRRCLGGLLFPVGLCPFPMYDKITAVSKDLQPEEMTGICRSDAFASCDGEPDEYGRLRVKHRGWTVTLVPDRCQLKVQGSLPTFANDNNLQLLTYSEMQCTIPALAAAVGLPVTRLVAVDLELSLDIEPSTCPQLFLETLQHHKQKKFCQVVPRNGSPNPLEYMALHTDFNVKLYNKNQHAKQRGLSVPAGQHKMRYEVFLNRARAINALWNRSETTLADLLSPDFYAAAAAELEQRWKEIARDNGLNYIGLSKKDRDLLSSRGSKEHWRGLKAVVSAITLKREKKEYAKLAAAMAKRIGPNEYDQLFTPALNALLPPVATTQNDTFFHTSGLLELSRMSVVKDAAPPLVLVADAGAGAGVLLPSPPAYLAADDDDEREPPTTAARCCPTCGAPIASHRKSEAQYCGKQCRNGASNPGHNARRTLRKIESQWQLFDQRPFVRVPEQIRAFVLAAA